MKESIGLLPTERMVTRSRRIRQLRPLVVLRIECKNEGGAEKESSIPRWMSRIGWSGYLRRGGSVPRGAAAAVRQAARTASESLSWGMGRVSGKFVAPAGLGQCLGSWWFESGDTVVAGVEPSRRYFREAWLRDGTTQDRRLGWQCCCWASEGNRCRWCGQPCVAGR